jgi:hypothetical protein
MSPAEGNGSEAEQRSRRLRYRIAFFLTSLVALSVVVTLPFSVKSVVDDILGPVTGRVVKITRDRPDVSHRNHTKLHMAFVAIDETQLLASIRVSGHHVCVACDWSDRVLFVSVTQDDLDADGMPPSVSVTLAQSNSEISELIQLPVRGHPIHYPFDSYRLVVGVVLQRLRPNSLPETLSPADAKGHLFLSVQELLPRQTMTGPIMLDRASIRAADDPFEYVAAAAAYSVFLRPLHDLVLNSGALVLGVWGIRSILTPANLYYLTAIDLALSVVIIFTLGAITVRAVIYVHDEAGMELIRRRRS